MGMSVGCGGKIVVSRVDVKLRAYPIPATPLIYLLIYSLCSLNGVLQ